MATSSSCGASCLHNRYAEAQPQPPSYYYCPPYTFPRLEQVSVSGSSLLLGGPSVHPTDQKAIPTSLLQHQPVPTATSVQPQQLHHPYHPIEVARDPSYPPSPVEALVEEEETPKATKSVKKSAAPSKRSTVTRSSGPATPAEPEEKLQRLRERRHVVACVFCRGRKVRLSPYLSLFPLSDLVIDCLPTFDRRSC